MQYVEYVKLAILVLNLLVKLIKDHRENKADPDSLVNDGVELLSKIGSSFKVKELSPDILSAVAPLAKDLIHELVELRKLGESKIG
jgi:hypothetical protein